jgi:rhodanese-related sulfurtransferase
MRKLSILLFGLLLILTSCDRGDDPGTNPVNQVPAYTLLKNHMIANDLDLDNILVNADGEKFVTGAPDLADLQTFLDKYYIIDIRANDAFTAGHIEGAVNVPLSDIFDEAPNASGKPILVVCYTGQSACYATSLLRMAGYSHTKALKWGMSGWNAATADSWNNATGDVAQGNANWVYSAAPNPDVFEDPVITSSSTDGAEILMERLEQVVADGFKGVNGTDVLNNPNDYFINNYFSEADYLGFGHITGAYRIHDQLLLTGGGYLGLDPDSNGVITYCYTGQTSAVITAWLRVLGYDAYSLKFGMNGLYHSNQAWTTNQWGVGSSVPKDLPLSY